QQVEIVGRIGLILIVSEPLDAGEKNFMTGRRKMALHSRCELAQTRSELALWGFTLSPLLRRRIGYGFEAGSKCCQARVHAHSAFADCVFKLFAGEGQRRCGSQRAKERRADHAAMFLS